MTTEFALMTLCICQILLTIALLTHEIQDSNMRRDLYRTLSARPSEQAVKEFIEAAELYRRRNKE